MPMFKPINDNEANPKVKKIFDEIKTTRKITIALEPIPPLLTLLLIHIVSNQYCV